ncbi:ABC transporter permease, partial [Streptococcus pyogenes]
LVLDQEQVMKVNLLGRYLEPGVDGYILGTDEGGKDIFGQLIIGARNSIVIGFAITIITSIVGISIGLISGYYGGRL